jgi:cardiolipin synthase A/B
MRRVKNVLLLLLALLVVGFATVGVLSLTRGTPVARVFAVGDSTGIPTVADTQFARTVALLTQVDLLLGNRVELATNGNETYPRLWDDLRSARRSITLQTYYAQPGAVADSLAAIVTERSRAGVRVLFLHDAFGAQNLPQSYFDRLRAAGVIIAALRPLHWWSLDKFSHRSHVRVVVVDGSVAWTGGFGLDDKWLGDGRTENQWRDTNVRFTGPAVMQLQATFIAGWAEATGSLIAGDLLLPPDEFSADGTQYAGLLHASPTVGSTVAERFLALSIAAARRRLYISNSYFVPDDDFRRLLVAAARRGVDVRILTTSDQTDIKTTWYAGRARYEELLEGGVRIWEYQPTMMHAKTLVVDGEWSSIGTLNFDNRSLAFNDESNLLVLDIGLGTRMERLFMDDLRFSREIMLDEFRRRPWTQKLWERGSNLLSRLL